MYAWKLFLKSAVSYLQLWNKIDNMSKHCLEFAVSGETKSNTYPFKPKAFNLAEISCTFNTIKLIELIFKSKMIPLSLSLEFAWMQLTL